MSVLYSNLLYFLLFSIVATTIFWLTPKKYRSVILLCINVLFYSLCAGWYIGFVLAVSGWSYFCANKISKIEEVQSRKKWLTCGIVPIILTLCFFKYRRWKANQWKHKLCFNESMFSAFLSGIWNHLMKPSSI